MVIVPDNIVVPAKLASFLAHRAADNVEAIRPIDIKTTRAKLEGAAEAAHLALGVGYTPAAVHHALLEVIDKAGPRPATGAAFPTARKAWEMTAAQAVIDALAALG